MQKKQRRKIGRGGTMDLLKLLAVFCLIIAMIKLKKPLYASIAAGIVGTSILYDIGIVQTLKIIGASSVSPVTISLVLAFYSITFLQRMLENESNWFWPKCR